MDPDPATSVIFARIWICSFVYLEHFGVSKRVKRECTLWQSCWNNGWFLAKDIFIYVFFHPFTHPHWSLSARAHLVSDYPFIFLGFFIKLDRECGTLTLHSSLKDLVQYTRKGLVYISQVHYIHNQCFWSVLISIRIPIQHFRSIGTDPDPGFFMSKMKEKFVWTNVFQSLVALNTLIEDSRAQFAFSKMVKTLYNLKSQIFFPFRTPFWLSWIRIQGGHFNGSGSGSETLYTTLSCTLVVEMHYWERYLLFTVSCPLDKKSSF